MKRLSTGQVKHFLRQTFLIGLFISLTVYAWVRMLFFEVPFTVKEDVLNVFKIVMAGWIMIMLLKVAFYSILEIVARLQDISLSPVKKEKQSPGYSRPVFKRMRSVWTPTRTAINS